MQPVRNVWSSSASSEAIRARANLLRQMRNYLDEAGFVEVQPPVLSSEMVIDRHIDPIEVQDHIAGSQSANRWFLQPSPEAALKRLLASCHDLQAVYSLGPVFRQGEWGQLHNPEFTMLEYYRCGDSLRNALELLDSLTRLALQTPPATVTTYRECFQEYLAIDVAHASLDQLRTAAVARCDVDETWSQDRDDWLHLLMGDIVQPQLGADCPVIVTHFPASQAALARLNSDDNRFAERFELYYRGVELANGYVELVDAPEFRRRCEEENRLREADGKKPLPLPEKLIAATANGLPASSGCAVGFDRLAMLCCEANRLSDVMLFTADKA